MTCGRTSATAPATQVDRGNGRAVLGLAGSNASMSGHSSSGTLHGRGSLFPVANSTSIQVGSHTTTDLQDGLLPRLTDWPDQGCGHYRMRRFVGK